MEAFFGLWNNNPDFVHIFQSFFSFEVKDIYE